ncbi:hypothetical protein HZA96_02745 [Candidatus Woesearchaeota archaeon]|nr:hypothetical protein [Candidatus Woesearchaeota archaeon]
MKVVYSPQHLKHNPGFEYLRGEKVQHFEKSERIENIKQELEKHSQFQFVLAMPFSESHIEKVHNANYITFLKNNKTTGIIFNEFCEDTFTFFDENVYTNAKNAADTALTGAKLLLEGEKKVYCLTRPPGHHARFAVAGGYCYFNNGVIAARYLQEQSIQSSKEKSNGKKVAFLDIDVHHGNGTEELVNDKSDDNNNNNFLSISMHLSTKYAYPYYDGEHSTQQQINIPLKKEITELEFLAIIEKAIIKLNEFHPDFTIILFGYDTYKEDPIAGLNLSIKSYNSIGKKIAAINSPLLILQEGGYVIDKAGEIAHSFLQGVENNDL